MLKSCTDGMQYYIHFILCVVVPVATESTLGVTGFHVGLRCLLLGATLITLGRLDEAEQVCILIVHVSSHPTYTDLEEDLPV